MRLERHLSIFEVRGCLSAFLGVEPRNIEKNFDLRGLSTDSLQTTAY